jgi:hypothetical protein
MSDLAIRRFWKISAAIAALVVLTSAPPSAIGGDQTKQDASASEPTAKKPEKTKPRVTISKETTYVTEPLRPDGYPDYAGALNRHFGKDVTPENNAAVLFWKAHGPHPEGATMPAEFFKLLGVELPEEGDYMIVYSKFLTESKKIAPTDERFNALNDEQLKAMQGPWKREEFPEIAEWLALNEQPLALVVEGTKRPKYFSPVVISNKENEDNPLIGVLLPGVQQSREFARALAARAMLRLGEGKTEEAWQDLLACHRLGRLVGRGPFMVEHLVGITIEGITTHADLAFIEHVAQNGGQAARYLRDLAGLPPLPDIAESVTLGERFTFLDSLLAVARNRGETIAPVIGGERARFPKLPPDSIDWDVTVSIGNQWFDRYAAVYQQKDRAERRTMLAAVDRDVKELARKSQGLTGLGGFASGAAKPKEGACRIIGNLMIVLLLPAISAADTADLRAHQHEGNVRIAVALAAYRSDHGRYPEKLSELAPKYLKEIPRDLFNGEPLIYRTTKDGYLFYSVGMNGQDDGGRARGDEPGEDGLRGDDVRVRMPARK